MNPRAVVAGGVVVALLWPLSHAIAYVVAQERRTRRRAQEVLSASA